MKHAYNLVGIDGNAFSVMGYVRNAMRETDFNKKEIEAYTKDCMSGDYEKTMREVEEAAAAWREEQKAKRRAKKEEQHAQL